MLVIPFILTVLDISELELGVNYVYWIVKNAINWVVENG